MTTLELVLITGSGVVHAVCAGIYLYQAISLKNMVTPPDDMIKKSEKVAKVTPQVTEPGRVPEVGTSVMLAMAYATRKYECDQVYFIDSSNPQNRLALMEALKLAENDEAFFEK